MEKTNDSYRIEIYATNPANTETVYTDDYDDAVLISKKYTSEVDIFKNGELFATKLEDDEDEDEESFIFYR